MARSDLQYFRNAGVKAPPKMQPQGPVETVVSTVKNVVGTAIAAPQIIKSKAKMLGNDLSYGHNLYKQGYGKYYDNALTVAKKGKANPDRH